MGVMKSPRVEPVGLIPDSFTEFYRREWRDVVGLGVVLTGNRWVAEDLAQEGDARGQEGESRSAIDRAE